MKWKSGDQYDVILFYKYYDIKIDIIDELIIKLTNFCEENYLFGRLLISTEGFNGTIAGSIESINEFIQYFENVLSYILPIDWKHSISIGNHLPFKNLSIRYVKELVSIGSQGEIINNNISYDNNTFGGLKGTGKHLLPDEFHSAIQSTDHILIDIRNEFEYNIGHFNNAINLNTFTYAETWQSLDKLKLIDEGKPVFMYCTGGIRCEKASAYLIAKGIKDVYQLQGGIHRYLESYPDGGHFKGKNFVFDSRMTIPANKEANNNESIDILGHCIDCNISCDDIGRIACTVCRMHVIVCQSCITSNPYNEFYCTRHRDLKFIYFTCLNVFNRQQLIDQLNSLQELKSNYQTRKLKQRRKTVQKQINRINNILLTNEPDNVASTAPRNRGDW